MASEEKINVLYVEDNENDVILMEKVLKDIMDFEFNLDSANTGREGLMRFSDDYDFLLLDNRMPGMNGLEVLDEVTSKESNVPIIMVTGKGDEKTAVEALKKGAYDYIVKDDLDTERTKESLMELIDLIGMMKGEEGSGFFSGLTRRRSTIGVITDILEASLYGINKTNLIYKTNLNSKRIKKYLGFLISKSFLVTNKDNGKKYKTTEKGRDLLELLKEVESMLS